MKIVKQENNRGELHILEKGDPAPPGAGRPKGTHNFKKTLQKALETEAPEEFLKILKTGKKLNCREVIALTQMHSAMRGDLQATKWVADRADGAVGDEDEEKENEGLFQLTFTPESLQRLSEAWENVKPTTKVIDVTPAQEVVKPNELDPKDLMNYGDSK